MGEWRGHQAYLCSFQLSTLHSILGPPLRPRNFEFLDRSLERIQCPPLGLELPFERAKTSAELFLYPNSATNSKEV